MQCSMMKIIADKFFFLILIFADDICVFSPSISGLRCLLNICGDYAAEHEITFNCNKTIVFFLPKKG